MVASRQLGITDVAIQLHVVEGSGIPVRATYAMHLNRAYRRHGSRDDLERMFALEDVTEQARTLVAHKIPDGLARMWDSLERAAKPDIDVGSHCERPYRCPFFGHCHQYH